jgi:hypothetical protein
VNTRIKDKSQFALITFAYLALLFPILRAPLTGDELINSFF